MIEWLLAGDPAIRWQTMRDLLDAPVQEWQAEREKTAHSGWGAQLLALQDANGGWGGGLYSPKWISTTYTLLTLCSIGLPRDLPAAQRGARLVLDQMLGKTCDECFLRNLATLDRCVVGMLLQISVYFMIRDERIEALVENLLHERMPDGAWNCRRNRHPETRHSSFHTTINVLEGIRSYVELGDSPWRDDLLAAEQTALEFMLTHRLYKSHRTGQVIHRDFTYLSFPPRWYYDVLRGLEYFARCNAPHDNRLQDAIDLLYARRRKDGLWPVQHKHPGKVFFDMEQTGGPSRWNTLRASRVLRWWES